MIRPLRASLPAQRGIGLVTAIFLLVVLAGLGVALAMVFRTHAVSSALDELGARAYQAARAGAEWGVYSQRINNSCAGSTSFAMPAGTSLAGFTVTVTCAQVSDPAGIDRFRVIATACNQPAGNACPNAAGNIDYVQRVVDVRFGE